jgi:hypothetical protein
MADDKIKQRLLLAIRKGDHDKVGKILEAHAGQISPNAEADTAQNRLLHRAARYLLSKIVMKKMKYFTVFVIKMWPSVVQNS